MSRSEFESKVAEYNGVKEELAAIDKHPINDEYKQAVIDAALLLYKRSPKNFDFRKAAAKLREDRLNEIRAPFQARATVIYDALCERKKALDKQLSELAHNLTPQAGTLEVVILSVYAGAYQSSGPRYGRGFAQLRADEVQELGIETRVESSDAEHRVIAKVASDADREIVKRKGVWTTREWVRRCWKAGLNPRVYDPFLPHGFEERVGLDYFGNEKKAVTG